MNNIICGNSDELLDELIEQGLKFDLVLTDPPYNINKDFGNDSDCLPLEDFLSVTSMRIEKLKKLLTPNGSIVWFGIHDYIGYVQVTMYNAGLYYRRLNIWHYENGFSRSKKEPATHYEPFLWFSNHPKKWTYNVDEVRSPYKSTERLKSPVKYKGSDGSVKIWQPNPKGAMRGDIWDFPTLAGKRFAKEKTAHPTQKPEKLLAKLILASSDPGDVILDPFLGSGSTSVTAKKLGRRYVGIEQNPQYCAWAEKRLEMAEGDQTIQGYTDGVFWERNTGALQKSKGKM